MKIKNSILIVFVTFFATLALGQNIGNTPKGSSLSVQPVFEQGSRAWADSVMASLTLDERIGQLFMVAAYSNKGAAHERALQKLIEKYHIGGLIFFQGGPVRQANMNNRLQALSKTPLWIGIDAEWGLDMRLDSTIKYPRQMTLGAIQDDSLIYKMGAEIAREAKRLGVHINFAPVVDVNNNPKNPVINSRSFGENKLWVTRKAIAYMNGMQDNGILANAKHFPGHGDTDSDSHKTLPLIDQSEERLFDLELYPYPKLFEQGLASVMVAHLSVPAFDSIPDHPSTLSPQIVNGVLKTRLGFEGLVFTDALNMSGVANYNNPGEVDLEALIAGNDVLLFPQNVPDAIQKIKGAIKAGTYSEEKLNASVRKILQAKAWAGLDDYQPVDTQNLVEDLNPPAALALKKKICEAAITLVQNQDTILPLKQLDERKIAVLTIGDDGIAFTNALAKYANFEKMTLPTSPTLAQGKQMQENLKDNATVIVNIEGTNNRPGRNFGLSQAAIDLAQNIALNHEVVLVHMGSPYALDALSHPERFKAIVVGYQDDPYLSKAAAAAIMGAIKVNGKLPVSAGDYFPAQTGMELADITRLHYSSPMEIGLPQDAFAKVDSIVLDGIAKRAYPGAQVLIAKDGNVIYDKSFGFHTYENTQHVESTDLYDLASITKIVASTISLMKLQDEGKFDLDSPLHTWFPEIEKGSPYYDMIPRRMLAHVAGLQAWIPFYKETLAGGQPMWNIYSRALSDKYSKPVAYNMYINKSYTDSIYAEILATPLRRNRDYKYSDLGYYFMREIIKRQSGLREDRFAAKNFYAPLGLNTMGYLPLNRFPKDRIVPTEYDTYFRHQLVHGYVHDPGAAMLGGVGGHAGVFSNAEDLAVIMQMLINKGVYGGERFLKASTIEEYIKCQYCEDELDENRRGAGFDKPVMGPGPGPTCKCVSFDTFGHSGFTGTIAWADPVENIVYIFLSNRVYPTAENNKLASMDIRTNIQAEIYKVLVPPADTLEASTVNP